MPSATAKPIVAVSIPTFASQKVIVAISSVSGKPLDMPSRKVIIGFLRRYGRKAGIDSATTANPPRIATKMINRIRSTDMQTLPVHPPCECHYPSGNGLEAWFQIGSGYLSAGRDQAAAGRQ